LTQASATVAGSCLSTCTFFTSAVSTSVVSLAESAFSVDVMVGDTFLAVMSGTMFCARNTFLGSVRVTKPFVTMAESVEKTLATSIWPPLRALMVSGPPVSSGLNCLKVRPYTSLRPTRPARRDLNSGPAPSTRFALLPLRSAMEVSEYFAAVSLVTVRVSLSSAGACSSTASPGGRAAFSSAYTPWGSVALGVLLK